MARIRSVNSGGLRHLSGVRGRTAILKEAVAAVDVRPPGPKRGGLGSGVVGDEIGHRQHHGGDIQAVYAVAREELDWWARELDRDLPDGWFGENLTIEGYDVDAALLGERWHIGSAVLEVTAPRIPCHTFATHMGIRDWVKRFSARGRTGAYLAVLEPGTIHPGDDLVIGHRPDHPFTVPDHFRACLGDQRLAREILDAGVLRPEEHAWLAKRAAGS